MIRLTRDSFGRLLLHEDGAATGAPVIPVRAFPLSAPDDGVGLVGLDGHELAWIDRLDEVSDDDRALLLGELSGREFSPVVRRISAVSGFLTPSVWTVETDQGQAKLILKSEEAIRRLPGGGLLIGDSRGITFQIRDVMALDSRSRRLLDRFL